MDQDENIPVIPVSELTEQIKKNLESSFTQVAVQGEISNFKRHSSGHLYFSLKDSSAQIGAVMFRGNTTSLRFSPKDGDKVTLFGALTVYPPSGRYQIMVHRIECAGVGELLAKLEALKKLIYQRGWFAQEHKSPIPQFAKTIGVITSPTGAVFQDILNVLTRRAGGFHLLLNPVRVQGEGAKEEIVQAIEQMNAYHLCDVIILGRGGGSIEDLWAFNEECVAKAIFESKIPIICSVGHETDHTIAEYVADLRAPTPSAAAELAVRESALLLETLNKAKKNCHLMCLKKIHREKERLKILLKNPLLKSAYHLLALPMQKLDEVKGSIDQLIQEKLRFASAALNGIKRQIHILRPDRKCQEMQLQLKKIALQIDQSSHRLIKNKKLTFSHLCASLKAIDPKNLLKKGYSIIFSEKENLVIKSVEQMVVGQQLKIITSDGDASAKVERITRSKR